MLGFAWCGCSRRGAARAGGNPADSAIPLPGCRSSARHAQVRGPRSQPRALPRGGARRSFARARACRRGHCRQPARALLGEASTPPVRDRARRGCHGAAARAGAGAGAGGDGADRVPRRMGLRRRRVAAARGPAARSELRSGVALVRHDADGDLPLRCLDRGLRSRAHARSDLELVPRQARGRGGGGRTRRRRRARSAPRRRALPAIEPGAPRARIPADRRGPRRGGTGVAAPRGRAPRWRGRERRPGLGSGARRTPRRSEGDRRSARSPLARRVRVAARRRRGVRRVWSDATTRFAGSTARSRSATPGWFTWPPRRRSRRCARIRGSPLWCAG